VFCWERAIQLKRDLLPVLNEKGIGLVVVGIGSLDSGRVFSKETGFPPDKLLVDESERTLAYQALGTRNSQRDAVSGKQKFEGIGSMWSSATTDAIKERGRDDLNSVTGNIFNPGPFKPTMPSSIEATLVQGGSFVFDGTTKTLLEHYDESSGAHITIEELLNVINAEN